MRDVRVRGEATNPTAPEPGSGRMGPPDVEITLAEDADAADILELQRLAYQSEARAYGDPNLPPLTQTLDQMRADLATKTVLKACIGNSLVGSVRAELLDNTCAVGRFIVHPSVQRQGIGTRLLREIEARFPDVERFELFTGDRSQATIRLYSSLGYVPFRRERQSPQVTLVYLEKLRSERPRSPRTQST